MPRGPRTTGHRRLASSSRRRPTRHRPTRRLSTGRPYQKRAPPALATPRELVGKSIDDLASGRIGAAARDDIKALRRGPLLIHGNYCGIGNRPGSSPVDTLDAACMRHDACTHTGGIPSCRCDDRLRAEALEIAQDPATRPDIAALATATAASMVVLVCR